MTDTTAMCPYPARGAPDPLPAAECIARGECGCDARALLSAPSPAVVERLRSALQECVWAMKADNPAEGWKDAIDEGEAALAQAGQPQEGWRDAVMREIANPGRTANDKLVRIERIVRRSPALWRSRGR